MECIINNLPVYYEEYGTGQAVLCIHGYFVDHRLMSGCLEPVFEKKDNYRRIYIDLPGMGKTPKDENIKSSDDVVDLLLQFIDKVIPNNDFILISESYGGYLSLALTYKIMDRIVGLFFICPAVIATHINRQLPIKKILVKQDINDITNHKYYNDFLSMAVVATPLVWQRYQAEILPGIQAADTKYLSKFQKTGYKLSYEEELYKMKYDKPAVMLLGKQDHVVGYNDMLFYLNNFSRGSLIIVDSAGHNLQIEQPEILNIHLEAFLNKTLNYINTAT